MKLICKLYIYLYSILTLFFFIDRLVAIVKFETPYKRIRYGLCTQYLSNLKENEIIFNSILKKGSIKLSENKLNPIVINMFLLFTNRTLLDYG